MRRTRHLPQRSCVACRQVRAKGELVRIVRTPQGEMRLDQTGKLAGRGAYLCRDQKCLEQALKQGKLGRALAVPVPAEVMEAVRESLAGRHAKEKQAAEEAGELRSISDAGA